MSLSGNHDIPLPANYKNQIKHGSYIKDSRRDRFCLNLQIKEKKNRTY